MGLQRAQQGRRFEDLQEVTLIQQHRRCRAKNGLTIEQTNIEYIAPNGFKELWIAYGLEGNKAEMKRHLINNWLPDLDSIFGAGHRLGNYSSWLCYMQKRARQAVVAQKDSPSEPSVTPLHLGSERLTGSPFAISPAREMWDGHCALRLDDARLRRRQRGGQSLSPSPGGRSLGGSICFLSLTDTCVGPMGAQLLREALEQVGVSGVEVVSAGTKATEGTPATVGAQRMVDDLSRHLANRLVDFDLRQIAHIYCTSVALKSLVMQQRYPGTKVTVLHLPDPYPAKERTAAEYGECHSILTEEVQRIAIRLKSWLQS